jgi:SAM-dependent methyltransferase
MVSTSFNNRIVRFEEIHDIKQEYFDALVSSLSIKDGDRLLDCGCGYGAVTREVLRSSGERRKERQEHIVIDLVDERSVQLTRAHTELNPWRTDPSITLNFHLSTFPTNWKCDSRYDAIAVKMVLHEMPATMASSSDCSVVTQPEFLDGIVRCLKPGGHVVLWDLCLSPSTRAFFASVLFKKDSLAGFETLATRRNFLSNETMSYLLEKSGLVQAHLVMPVTYEFSTRRRLLPELNGSNLLLEEWHEYIRFEANRLPAAVLRELRYTDRGDDISFAVKLGIFRAKKSANSQFTLGPFRGAGFGNINVTDPARSYFTVTAQTLSDNRLLRNLDGHQGLMRESIMTRARTGLKDLCLEWMELFYNSLDHDQRFHQATAYLTYLTGLYCGIKSRARGSTVRSMSDALSNAFRLTASTGWLIASLSSDNSVSIEVGAFDAITGLATVKVPGLVDTFFEQVSKRLREEQQLFDFQEISSHLLVLAILVRSKAKTADRDLDSGAEALADDYFDLLAETLGRIADDDVSVEVFLPCQQLQELLANRIVLANLCGYLKFSETPYCYFVLPPSLLMSDARLEAGTFILSSHHRLDDASFEELLQHVAGLWSGIGSLEALAYGRRTKKAEEQRRQLAIVAGASHAFKNLLTPLKGGLRNATAEGSALRFALGEYEEVIRDPAFTEESLPALLRARNVVPDGLLLRQLFGLAGSLSAFRNIVERLWGKIYGLHISSLDPGEVHIDRWCREVSVPHLLAGSFFCSWYAFCWDDSCLALRSRKGFTESFGAQLVVEYVNEEASTLYEYHFAPIHATRAGKGSGKVIRSIDDVERLRERDSAAKARLPAVIVEAVTEEAFFNAIKYGDLASPISVSLVCRERTMDVVVKNRVFRGLPSQGGGRGLLFLQLLAENCGAAFERSEGAPEEWVVRISNLPLGREIESKK